MDELRLRARSVSEIVDAAFMLYRRDPVPYILLTAIATVPQLVTQLFLRASGTPSVASLVPLLIGMLASSVTYAVGSAAIIKLGSAAYLGEPADLAAAIRTVVPRIGAIITAGVMKYVLYAIGLLCFIVGALYVAARFFAVDAAIILEDRGPVAAFERSSELSEGRKRHVLNTLLLVWIIYFLLSVCVGLGAGLFGSPVLTIVVSTLYSIVAFPVIGLTKMLLYYDMRIRGEGFDLERMAAALAPAAAPTGPAAVHP